MFTVRYLKLAGMKNVFVDLTFDEILEAGIAYVAAVNVHRALMASVTNSGQLVEPYWHNVVSNEGVRHGS